VSPFETVDWGPAKKVACLFFDRFGQLGLDPNYLGHVGRERTDIRELP
jgi:hypothetical protein